MEASLGLNELFLARVAVDRSCMDDALATYVIARLYERNAAAVLVSVVLEKTANTIQLEIKADVDGSLRSERRMWTDAELVRSDRPITSHFDDVIEGLFGC